jgi:hypothetical protein
MHLSKDDPFYLMPRLVPRSPGMEDLGSSEAGDEEPLNLSLAATEHW